MSLRAAAGRWLLAHAPDRAAEERTAKLAATADRLLELREESDGQVRAIVRTCRLMLDALPPLAVEPDPDERERLVEVLVADAMAVLQEVLDGA